MNYKEIPRYLCRYRETEYNICHFLILWEKFERGKFRQAEFHDITSLYRVEYMSLLFQCLQILRSNLVIHFSTDKLLELIYSELKDVYKRQSLLIVCGRKYNNIKHKIWLLTKYFKK